MRKKVACMPVHICIPVMNRSWLGFEILASQIASIQHHKASHYLPAGAHCMEDVQATQSCLQDISLGKMLQGRARCVGLTCHE